MTKGTQCGDTRFGRRFRRLGVSRVLQGMHQQGVPITRQALYNYLSGNRSPVFEVRVALSRLGFNPDDLDRHVLRMRARPSLTTDR